MGLKFEVYQNSFIEFDSNKHWSPTVIRLFRTFRDGLISETPVWGRKQVSSFGLIREEKIMQLTTAKILKEKAYYIVVCIALLGKEEFDPAVQ